MFRLFVDSADGVSLDPEWDYSIPDEKIEQRGLSSTGKSEVYKYGDRSRITFTVMYVSSDTAAAINSYWQADMALLFMEEGATEVFSCRIINEKTPISKNEKPYPGAFSGTIELGTY